MIFYYNENRKVAVLFGAGSMGIYILKRMALGMKILLSDKANFITGKYMLIDGGSFAAINTGKYQVQY